MIEPKPVFVRGYPLPAASSRSPGGGRVTLEPSPWSVTFDTETTTDAAQRLRVGSFQVRYAGTLHSEGIFYDPTALSHRELQILDEYRIDHPEHQILEAAEWVDQVLLFYGADLGGLIVGFNLKFDISRIATGHFRTGGTGLMQGGFTFEVGDRRIQVKPAGAKSTFMRFSQRDGRSAEQRNRDAGGNAANFTGHFLDVAQLATALLSESRTLRDLADLLETPTRKHTVDDYSAPIGEEFLAYALADVQVTWECFEALNTRYQSLGLPRPVTKIVSEASIGKAHLDLIGLRPWSEVDPEFPTWLTASVMETYYGGRTECHIRRIATPGAYVDFLSQYPTSYTLQGLWEFHTAAWIDWHDEHPDTVTAMLDGLTAANVLDRGFWRQLSAIVWVEPDGDLLPSRCEYGPDTTLNVALSHRVGGPAQWYTLADVAASVLHTGNVPRISRVIRFEPGPPQPDLKPIRVGDVEIDPYTEDMIRRFIEVRRDLKTQAAKAAAEKALLTARQIALKTTANAVCYGTGIEMNTSDYIDARTQTIAHTTDTTFEHISTRVENQGRWFHPIIASLTAAGGRLMLAAAMRLVADAGGTYVFSDTDSLFIASTETGGTMPCPGAPNNQIRLLSWEQVDSIIDQFRSLNPYGFDASILELEAENYLAGQRRELLCWSIASKRYALYRIIDGQIVLAVDGRGNPKRSEHGLGHLINPTGDTEIDWISQWWTHLIGLEHDLDTTAPDWLTGPAIGRLSVASHHELAAFDRTGPYEQQVRPFGFMLIAHTDPIYANLPNTPRCVVAGYERDASRWLDLDWFDRGNPTSPTYTIRTTDPHLRIKDQIPVKTLDSYFGDYRVHADTKTADHTGQPTARHTRGLLQPRTITATQIIRVGKEHNRLNHGPIGDRDDAQRFTERRCTDCGTPLTGKQRAWCSATCRVQHRRRNP